MRPKVNGKRRICVISPTLKGGGAERIAVNLSRTYSDLGHEVYLIVFSDFGPLLNHVADSVILVVLNKRIRSAFFKLRKELKAIQPEIVISTIRDSNVVTGLVAPFVKDCTFIFREANTMDTIKGLSALKSSVLKLLMRTSYHFANKVIANSEDTRTDLIKLRIIRPAKCIVIGNPIVRDDMFHLAGAAIDDKWLSDPDVIVILAIGRLHKQKDHACLIHAFKSVQEAIPAARLLIIGEGEEFNCLNELVRGLDLSHLVRFEGFKDNPYPYYKNCDLFVLSSRWEGFGNVLVEAMACGAPIVSTNCPGGPKEILKNGLYGVLVPVGNAKALSSAIVDSLIRAKPREDLESARLRAMDFSMAGISKQYLESVES